MSLFRSEVIGLALAPGGVAVARGGSCLALPASDGDWPTGLAAVGTWLAAERPRRGLVRLLVSNSHVRICTVPWPGRHLTTEQQLGWTALQFETAYGDMQGWQTVLDPGVYGQPRVACAMPAALVQQWHALCGRYRLGGGALQPYVVAAWNHWRRLARPGQFWGVAESDRIVWAHRGARGWASIHVAKAALDADNLPGLAVRELRLQDAAQDTALLLHQPGQGAPAAQAAQRWLALSPQQEPASHAMARLAAQP